VGPLGKNSRSRRSAIRCIRQEGYAAALVAMVQAADLRYGESGSRVWGI
jgi:hypothetical protein